MSRSTTRMKKYYTNTTNNNNNSIGLIIRAEIFLYFVSWSENLINRCKNNNIWYSEYYREINEYIPHTHIITQIIFRLVNDRSNTNRIDRYFSNTQYNCILLVFGCCIDRFLISFYKESPNKHFTSVYIIYKSLLINNLCDKLFS